MNMSFDDHKHCMALLRLLRLDAGWGTDAPTKWTAGQLAAAPDAVMHALHRVEDHTIRMTGGFSD